MSLSRGTVAAAVLGAALAACAPLAPAPLALPGVPAPEAARQGAPEIAVREHLSGRYIALIGPKAAHGAPYLDIPGTNFYCLRSFVDRDTAATAHQLYVADSYDAPERHWDMAHDQAGRALVFVPISHDTISCEAGCSYSEEFAANLTDDELRENPEGLRVTFSDRAGDNMTLTLSADQITAQLAAVAAQQRTHTPPSPAPSAPVSPPPAHQPE